MAVDKMVGKRIRGNKHGCDCSKQDRKHKRPHKQMHRLIVRHLKRKENRFWRKDQGA